MLAGYNLRQIPHHFGVQPKTDPLRCDMLRRFLFAHRRFLFAHICRNSLFIICSLQNSSYCLLSTISGIFTINALLQQPCVPFHFDKQASFATSTPTNFCLQNHKQLFLKNQPRDFITVFGVWFRIELRIVVHRYDTDIYMQFQRNDKKIFGSPLQKLSAQK